MSNYLKTNVLGLDCLRALCGIVAAAVLPGTLVAEESSAAASRPNLLWIVADDLGLDLACYGEPHVSTPNLDRLASEGVLFTRAFATSPVCSSSRSAYITGMYQTSIGAHHHRAIDAFPELPEPVVPLPQLLKEAGYCTTNQSSELAPRRRAKTDFNFLYEAEDLFSGEHYREAAAGQPFFAQIQIYPPHRPFPRDPVEPERLEGLVLPPYYPEHPLVRRDWAAYLLGVEELDRAVGAALDALEESGQAENTIVVFFGDHGRAHLRDKQWLYEGGLATPLIVRWPGKLPAGEVRDDLVSLIDLAPTCLEWLGEPVPEWMQGRSFADPAQGGRDFIFGARDRCGDAEDRIRSVRDERFKYIRNFFPERPYLQTSVYKEMGYPAIHVLRHLHALGELDEAASLLLAETRPPEELYDLESDPHEIHNLADEPAHRERLEALRARVDAWIEETGDQGGEIEDPEMVQGYREERFELWTRFLEREGISGPEDTGAIIEMWMRRYE